MHAVTITGVNYKKEKHSIQTRDHEKKIKKIQQHTKGRTAEEAKHFLIQQIHIKLKTRGFSG